MQSMDRRSFLRAVVGGAAVAGVTTAGVAMPASTAEALPLAAEKNLPQVTEDFVEKTQWRGGRRWRCWWSSRRRRRVCGWVSW
jgi:hypothetical protein